MTRAIDDLARSALDLKWHLDPVQATAAGVTQHDARYGRFSREGLRPHLAALRSLAGALEQAETGSLDEEIDRTALLDDVRVSLARLESERPQATNPEFFLSHLLAGLHYLLARRDYTHAQRVAALGGRLSDAPAFLDDARAALEEPVALFAGTACTVVGGGLLLLAQIAQSFPSLGDAVEDAERALRAFEAELQRWQEAGDATFAIGEQAFNFRLHHQHALRSTAPELWRYGLGLVEEVEAELAQWAGRFGARHWPDVAERLRADHPDAAGLVAAYGREMERAREFVRRRDLVDLPPEPLEVAPTPAFMRPLVPFAAYQPPGPYSRDRSGWFYVTVPDGRLDPAALERVLRDHCIHEMAATALHEGFPGHHLQLTRTQALPSEVRRHLWSPLTVEGWALYCEEMMGEQGFYETQEQQFFQRVHLLLRAVRILLDVGLHTRGMTFTEARDLLESRVHLDRTHAEAEVRRYCAEPAYQLAYAVGRRELLALRSDLVGRGSTLREFHETVLRFGGLPVTLMRWGLGLD